MGFLAAGFGVEERLHLLGIELDRGLLPVPDGLRLARGGRQRMADALIVDGVCFSPFWRFDEDGLGEAIRATPRSRFRVALTENERVVGYAVCGRAGRRGYVQRLAVLPEQQGHGTGARLLLDGLHWLRRYGARRAVVNTQMGNEVALALYHRIGFRDEPVSLSVLSTGLP
jgi:ribosomal protein S18 acetylase RimI-like enzyme